MTNAPKIIAMLAAAVSFTFFAKNSMAQYPGMRAVNQRIDRNFMNQQMQMMQQMQMTGSRWKFNDFSPEFTFKVTLLDGSTKDVVSAIYTDSVTKKSYLLLSGKHNKATDTATQVKLYPSQTQYISRNVPRPGYFDDGTAPEKPIFGKAADTCWMFCIKKGPLSLYSFLSQTEGDDIIPSAIVGIQLNDKAILQYNEGNLKQLILQDAGAMEYFNKKKYLKAVEKFNKDAKK